MEGEKIWYDIYTYIIYMYIYICEIKKLQIIGRIQKKRVVEELSSKPQKFGRSEIFCEAIRYYVVGPDVFWCDLLRRVENTDIMLFEGYVSGLSGYLWCNAKQCITA